MDFAAAYQFALRLFISGALLWLMSLCGLGIYRLWRPTELVYRNFSYSREGTDDVPAGLHFTQLVNYEVRKLHRQLSPPAGIDSPFVIPTVNEQGGRVEPVDLPRVSTALLPDIEFQAYGINFSSLANRLFQRITPPNEIVGTVTESRTKFDVFLELHRLGPSTNDAGAVALVTQQDSKENAAFASATRIYRLLSAERRLIYGSATDAEFEVFARALHEYELYRAAVNEERAPSIVETAQKETDRLLSGLLKRNSKFPPPYKLSGVFAYSKGQLPDAIRHLEEYVRLWPKSLPEDTHAQQLLASYRKELVAAESLTAVIAETNLKERVRPVVPGLSISASDSTAGTLCCIVRDQGHPKGPLYLLSADFVVGTKAGTKVVQPGTIDGGQVRSDVIGEVVRAIASKPGETITAAGAIAKLDVEARGGLEDFRFNGVGSVQLGQTVRKLGRTTGLTSGTVTAINVTMQIGFEDGVRTFSGLLEVRGTSKMPFSRAGDAGSPVIDENNRLIGMHFAGSSSEGTAISFVMPIAPILQKLGVELVP